MSSLYHYTSSEGRKGILRDGVIRSSRDTTLDAVLGVGVYLTALPPETNTWVLLANNYDSRPEFYLTKLENVEYCIEFRMIDLPYAKKGGGDRDVWMVPYDIDLRKVQFRVWKRK
jgi:hypothetical protein